MRSRAGLPTVHVAVLFAFSRVPAQQRIPGQGVWVPTVTDIGQGLPLYVWPRAASGTFALLKGRGRLHQF